MSNNNGGVESKVKFEVKIVEKENGEITVSGFPAEYQKSMNIMATAQRVVMDFFMSKAVAGEFRQQKIFRPDSATIGKLS